MLEKILKRIDDRGWLAELVSAPRPIGHVYVTTCLPGVVKAWHLHKKQTDRFILLSGRLMVGLVKDEKATTHVLMPFESVLTIEPNIWHGFSALGSEEAEVLNCTDRAYDPSDEHRLPPDNFEFSWKPVSR